MVIDIHFWNKSPEQIQQVTMVKFYSVGCNSEAEVVISIWRKDQRNIPLSSIREIMITND